MAKGKLSEDTVRFILEADSSQAQQEIHKTNKSIESLEQQKKKLLERQAAMERAHLTETKEYKELTREIKKNEQAIANENLKLQELYKKLGTGSMTMSQLRKEAKNLQKQLDNTSKALQPQAYKQYADKLSEVKQRMTELRGTAEQVKGSFGGGGFFKNLFGADLNFSSLKTMLANSGIIAAVTFIAGQVAKVVQAAFEKVKWFYDFNVQVEEARRLTREFLNTATENLTHVQSQISAIAKQLGKEYKEVLGSVDTLMNQFGLTEQEAIDNIKDGIQAGADVNGTFLSQIQRYAPAFRDAGAPVKDLVALITQTRSGIFNEQGMNLIQTATNRIRTMSTATQKALDDIGISSQQLEQDLVSGKTSIIQAIQMISARIMQLPGNSMQVGEVMKDVFGKTASNEGMKMIDTIAHISTNMDDLKKLTGEYGELQRKQIDTQAELNEKLSDMFGIGKGGFEEMTTKASIFILRGLIKTIDYCKSLYDELAVVRVAVEIVRGTFDTAFKLIEFGFNIIIDLVKLVAGEIRGLSNVVEGFFTFDFSQMERGWKQMKNTFFDKVKEMIDDGSDVGSRWGQNLVEGYNRVVAKEKLKAPQVDGNNLPDVVVTGKRGGEREKDGTIGNELDSIAKKIDALKAKRLTIKVGDTKVLKALDNQISALEKRKASLEYKSGSGKSKNEKKGADHDTLATKDFSHDRSQDLDEAKRAYQEDINALQKALTEKRLTQEQYNAYVSALNIQHQNNLLAIEQSYLQRSQAVDLKDKNKRRQLQEQQSKAVADQQQAVNNAYLDAEKQYYSVLDKMQQMRTSAVPQTLQQECDAKLLVLDGYYQASLQLAGDDAERQKQITESYEAAKAAIVADYARKQQDEKARARQEYGLDTFEDQLAARRQKINEDHAKGLLSEQQHQQALANLSQQAEEQRLQIRKQYGLVSQQELYNAELELLKQHLQNKKMTEEEYEEAVKKLNIGRIKEAFDYYSNLTNGALKSLHDAEVANVETKYDAEIEAAKNAGKDTTELEKKKANETLKIQKKYADVDFAMTASKIIADTAGAIMGAWDTFKGNPVAAGIVTALISATSLAQLATANAERQKVRRMSLNGAGAAASGARVATGLESGGSIDVERRQDGRRFHADYDPTKRGFVDKPTVIVGEGGYGHSREWVASNAAVENPTVAPIIDIIDRAQRAGTIRTLDMNRIMMQQNQFKSNGGYLSEQPKPDTTPTRQEHYSQLQLVRLTEILERLADEGIPASVSLTEIEQKQELRRRARNFASK